MHGLSLTAFMFVMRNKVKWSSNHFCFWNDYSADKKNIQYNGVPIYYHDASFRLRHKENIEKLKGEEWDARKASDFEIGPPFQSRW